MNNKIKNKKINNNQNQNKKIDNNNKNKIKNLIIIKIK